MEPHFDAYLQHGTTAGPFRTEYVEIRHSPRNGGKACVNPPWASNWEAKVDGEWRRIWIDGHTRFIRFQGEVIKVTTVDREAIATN